MRRILTVLVLAATCVVGCAEEGDRVPVMLSWQLADGRDCAEAGISEVEVTVTAASAASSTFECADGLVPNQVDLGAFERGIIELEVTALSPFEQPLYQADGRTELRGDASRVVLELGFTGGAD